MFSWAKQTLAHVAGTQEPIYGPSAIRSVAQDAEHTPYTEIGRKELLWQARDSTSVETLTFYFMSDSGNVAFCQVIYSNVAGIRTTCQFNAKIFFGDDPSKMLWSTTPLQQVEFSEDKANFYAKDVAVELSEDGTHYTIKSMADEECIVNLKVTKKAPGFVAGKDGVTLFGTDLTRPWGSMRHAFWPRCWSEGNITTPDGVVDFTGRSFFVYALQGMKPHHAAARWNFVNFQGPTYSAIMMEFTTPPSYGSTVVNVGAIARDGEIIVGGANGNTATHVTVRHDSEIDWPEPEVARFTWAGKAKDGSPVEASLEGNLGTRLDRIDVMAEVPGFVKKIVSSASGAKPYIYQYAPRTPQLSLKLKIGDKEVTDTGYTFQEATFISE